MIATSNIKAGAFGLAVVVLLLCLPARGRAAEPTRGDIETVELHERSTSGLCVDKAYHAAQELEALGVAPDRLMFVVIRLDPDTAHMILLLDGKTVLDNRYRGLVNWADYRDSEGVLEYSAGTDLATLHRDVWR